MSQAQKERRGLMTLKQMEAIQPHQEWDDGRYDSLFCRFDSIIDDVRFIRAEVTWNDNTEGDPERNIEIYYDPLLCLESNRPDPEDPDSWITIDTEYITLDRDEAVRIVEHDPVVLLDRYGEMIDKLLKWEPKK